MLLALSVRVFTVFGDLIAAFANFLFWTSVSWLSVKLLHGLLALSSNLYTGSMLKF